MAPEGESMWKLVIDTVMFCDHSFYKMFKTKGCCWLWFSFSLLEMEVVLFTKLQEKWVLKDYPQKHNHQDGAGRRLISTKLQCEMESTNYSCFYIYPKFTLECVRIIYTYEYTPFSETLGPFQKANPTPLWMRSDNLLGLMDESTLKDHLLWMLPAVI